MTVMVSEQVQLGYAVTETVPVDMVGRMWDSVVGGQSPLLAAAGHVIVCGTVDASVQFASRWLHCDHCRQSMTQLVYFEAVRQAAGPATYFLVEACLWRACPAPRQPWIRCWRVQWCRVGSLRQQVAISYAASRPASTPCTDSKWSMTRMLEQDAMEAESLLDLVQSMSLSTAAPPRRTDHVSHCGTTAIVGPSMAAQADTALGESTLNSKVGPSGVQFEPLYLEWTEEPSEKAVIASELAMHQQRLDRYFDSLPAHRQLQERNQLSLATTRSNEDRADSYPSSTVSDGDRGQETSTSVDDWHDESYEKVNVMDRVLWRFQKQVKKAPWQLIRYAGQCTGHEPLLYSSMDTRDVDLQRCTACGAVCGFEFQLMPALMDRLRSGGDVGADRRIPLEFGTICVYTCTRSCSQTPAFLKQHESSWPIDPNAMMACLYEEHVFVQALE